MATVYVGGILPRVDDESFLTPVIVEINKSLASMCKILHNIQKIDVKWLSLYKLFLERAMYESPVCEDTRYHTRVRTPHDTFFMPDGRDLTEQGRLQILKYVLSETGIKPGCSSWTGMPLVTRGVQEKEEFLEIIKCRGKKEKEWEEEDEIERFLRAEDMVVVDEIGPTSAEESEEDGDAGTRCNLTIHVDWDEAEREKTPSEISEQPWVNMLVDRISGTSSSGSESSEQKQRLKKRPRKNTSSGESREGERLVSETDNGEVEARMLRREEVPRDAVVAETESDDLGEGTVVAVRLGDE